ncbi:hypothetical protein REPUB_Repub13aG0099100 [Reevesia pubescens]
MNRQAALVKNKSSNPVQLTAEQLVRDSRVVSDAAIRRPVKRKISDADELEDYKLQKRKEFEDKVKQPKVLNFNPSREALKGPGDFLLSDFFKFDHPLLLHIAFLAPDKFISEFGGFPVAGSDEDAQKLTSIATHINECLEEEQMKDINPKLLRHLVFGARVVLNSMAAMFGGIVRPEIVKACSIKFHHLFQLFYFDSVESLSAEPLDPTQVFAEFAEFEVLSKETERARSIYKFALNCVPKEKAVELYSKFVAFEKQYGDKQGIEDAIVWKRRFEYEDEVRKNPLNYDAWFDYINLEETVGEKDRIRHVFERAILNVPPLDAGDVERARDVYKECLKLIPHSRFSFSKVWILSAQLELRVLNLKAARCILGTAIGMAPKPKIFNKYIELELQLGNIDRCRKLYEKYLEWSPERCYTWVKYAELEMTLCEVPRARAIFELGIAQPVLDKPELLWKSYIGFEDSQGESECVTALKDRLERKRNAAAKDGFEEEYIDYQFKEQSHLNLLASAYRWKMQKSS